MSTITTTGIIAALLSVGLSIAALINDVAAAHRAQLAADLAAVAAAHALYEGADACTTARETATINSATLKGCTIDGADVEVTAATTTLRTHSRTARAGPL